MTFRSIMALFVGVAVILLIIWVLNRPQLPTRNLVQAALR